MAKHAKTGPGYSAKAEKLIGGNPLVFNDVDLAVEFGGTHVSITEVPFRYDDFLPDNTDPYPNWSQTVISLFRVFPPPALKKFMPAKTVKLNREFLDKRFAQLRKRKLRAFVGVHEPLWLPEEVFRAHPNWRGSQCELGRIAAKPYFVPSIDDPEVLELYRWSMREWCKAYPETHVFSSWTNDCGSGVPWSVLAYTGPNGPMKYRGRNPGERVAGWMKALCQGAADAQGDVMIQLHSFTFPPGEMSAIRDRLGAEMYLNGVNGKGESFTAAGAACGSDAYNEPFSPVAGLANPLNFFKQLQDVFGQGGAGLRNISIGSRSRELGRAGLKLFLDEPCFDAAGRARLAQKLAESLAGKENATALCDVWQGVEQACHAVRQIRQRGLGLAIPFGLTTARWLSRPLVPEPLKLAKDEEKHYLPYLFSCASREDNANFGYILGKPVFIGDGVTWMARWCLQEAIGTLQGARSKVKAMAERAGNAQKKELEIYAARIGAFACCLETAKWALLYQQALATASQPRFGANPLDFDDNIQYDQRALEMRKIARAELDNMAELISIIEAYPDGAIIDSTPGKATENVFIYGPELATALRHKMDVMLNHWHDYERLYPTSKLYEFEPKLMQAGVEKRDVISD